MLETQEGQWYKFQSESGVDIQEELVFQFDFEGRKRPMSLLKQSGRRNFLLLSFLILFMSSIG